MDWSGCPLVVSRPGYVSGAPALRDDPRMPVQGVIENMDDDEEARTDVERARNVVEMFGLRTSVADVLAIYDYAKRQRVTHDPV